MRPIVRIIKHINYVIEAHLYAKRNLFLVFKFSRSYNPNEVRLLFHNVNLTLFHFLILKIVL